MKNIDIQSIIYNNNEVSALYKGGTLIYRIADNVLSGKFTEVDWIDYHDYSVTINGDTIPLTLNDDKSFSLEVDGLTTYSKMFYKRDELQEIKRLPKFTGDDLCSADRMFYNCISLEKINLSAFEGLKVTDMTYMFFDCAFKHLDLSHFQTDNVTSMKYMFCGCNDLVELDLSNFNTANVTTMEAMFEYCSGLKELDLSKFNTANVTTMKYMFDNCTFIEKLNLSNFNFQNVTILNAMFDYCYKLTTVIGPIYNVKSDLSLEDSPLTNSSAMVFINGLADVDETKTIKFKSTTFDTLSDEQIATATSKGWSVVSV